MDENQDGPSEMDKRKTRRVKGAVVEYSNVEYSISDETSSKKVAFLKDLSSGGLAMFVTEPIEKGSELYLTIYLSGPEGPIMAKGKVMWQQNSSYMKGASTKHYDVGIKFLDINDENKSNVAKYVEEYLEEDNDEYKL